MKIASFNLRHGGKNSFPENSWKQLLKQFAPDLVLAQETFHPNQYLSVSELSGFSDPVWECVPDRKWGSAILSAGHPVGRVPLPGFEGWVTGGRMPTLKIGGSNKQLLVFSLHAPRPYERKLNQILDAIRALRDECDLVLGGDFNVTTAMRHPSETLKNTSGELRILERLRTEFGLVNAWQASHPYESLPQTLKWWGSLSPLPLRWNLHSVGLGGVFRGRSRWLFRRFAVLERPQTDLDDLPRSGDHRTSQLTRLVREFVLHSDLRWPRERG